jgi:hypothetical protein
MVLSGLCRERILAKTPLAVRPLMQENNATETCDLGLGTQDPGLFKRILSNWKLALRKPRDFG